MAQVVVASTNPAKISAVTDAFRRVFGELEVTGVDVSSGVSDQPTSDTETYQGAHNRAHAALALEPDAEYWVGIEGGLEEYQTGELMQFAWAVVVGRDGRVGKGKSASFFLPEAVATLVRGGMELGKADEQVFGRVNGKHANGIVGILTGDAIDRTRYTADAVVLALIPFKNESLY